MAVEVVSACYLNVLLTIKTASIFKHASSDKVFTFDVLIVHKFKSRFLSFPGTEPFRVWKKYKAGAKERWRLKLMSRYGSLIDIVSFLFLITCCSFSSFLQCQQRNVWSLPKRSNYYHFRQWTVCVSFLYR